MPKRNLTWWFWLATDFALANYLFIDREFIKAAIALAAIQVPVFAKRSGGMASFPAQVRLAYLALLIIGLWPPLSIVHWIQFVGTTAMVFTGYCFLARCLTLLPFNRTEPMSGKLLARTFLSQPVDSSILANDTARNQNA